LYIPFLFLTENGHIFVHAFFVHCEKRDWQGIWTVQF